MYQKIKLLIGFNPVAWIKNTRRMLQLASEMSQTVAKSKEGLYAGVVVTPWLGTSVPWFTVGIGLLLARKGHQVTFILDDFVFGKNRLRYSFVLACLRTVLRRIEQRHKVVVMSQVVADKVLEVDASSQIRNLAVLNTVWEFRGEMKSEGRSAFEDLCEKQLQVAYAPIKRTVSENKFDLLFMPGGVWGTTGIWAASARAAGTRIGSFDSGGYGTAMLAVDGIACQLQDIPRAFALIAQDPDSQHSMLLARQAALAEMESRRAGIDPFMSQIKGSADGDDRHNGAVLLALNSSWDSAALGLHTIFEDNTDWIIQTVRFLLENTAAPVIVRQHPAERLEIAKTTDDYGTLLQKNFGSHPRLHFIAAADKINSYELMSRVRALVVYTSTIGIEAAAHGKPVITPSRSYYSGLGFVYKATELNQYQDFLKKSVSGELHVSVEQKNDALICYYLTQCCNWIFTSFNPADYSDWSKRSMDHWFSDKEVSKMLYSLDQKIPISYVNHMEKIGKTVFLND
jgi:hypothetical protein